MRRSRLATLAAVAALAACVPGSPIYFGPPIITIEGTVFAFETQEPIPNAEVCAFGADTTCVQADRTGRYRLALAVEHVDERGELTLRFRIGGIRPAVTTVEHLEPGTVTAVSCAISTRMSLSREPTACLPPPEP